jgi:hypothetical protein
LVEIAWLAVSSTRSKRETLRPVALLIKERQWPGCPTSMNAEPNIVYRKNLVAA